MCWDVQVNGKWCSNMGELRKAIYPRSDAIVISDGYPAGTASADCCLCPLDKIRTAANLGMIVTQIEGGDWVFSKPSD